MFLSRGCLRSSHDLLTMSLDNSHSNCSQGRKGGTIALLKSPVRYETVRWQLISLADETVRGYGLSRISVERCGG